MAVSVFKYSNLASKIGVMYGRMLSIEDYEELTSKKTVKDVAAYLKYNTHYNDVLSEVNENIIHRGQLEKIFKNSLLDDYFKLFHYVRGNVKKFLRLVFLKYEIEDLKILLRVLNTEHNTKAVRDSLLFLRKYCTIDLDKLAKSKDIQDFILNLKGSKYYNILAPFIVNKEYANIFNIEMSLDLYFFSLIWKNKDKLLGGHDREIITSSFGEEIDVQNILYIYRSKRFHNVPKEIIYSYLIPFRKKLSHDAIVSMVEAKEIEDVMDIIKKTKYAEIFNENNDHFFDRNFSIYVYKRNKNFMKNEKFSIGLIMAYLHLKEIEIKFIVSIIEGIRYSLPPGDLKKNIFLGGV
jgi:V/A-type H+-transporting ATPase subunit C